MKAPIIKATLKDSGRDLSEYIERMTFEESTEEDNAVELSVYEEKSLGLADDAELIAGNMIYLQFGFMGGRLSKVHELRICDTVTDYSNRVTFKIICMDKGIVMKKVTDSKIYKGMSGAQVAHAIGKLHGLKVIAQDTGMKHDNIPQANTSDFDVLRGLAKKEEGGNFVCFVTGQTLYYIKMDLSKKSKYLFKYGEESFKKFNARVKDSITGAEVNDTETVSVTSASKKTETANADKKDTSLGTNEVGWNADGELLGRMKKIIPTPAAPKGKNDNKSKATTTTKKAKMKMMEGALQTEGDPDLTINEVGTIMNVAQKHAGNWYVTKCKHEITASRSYGCTLTMNKDATIKPVGVAAKKAEKVNKTTGDNKKKTTKVYTWDADGNPTGDNPYKEKK